MTDVLNYIWLGVLAVFQGPELFSIFGFGIPAAPADPDVQTAIRGGLSLEEKTQHLKVRL